MKPTARDCVTVIIPVFNEGVNICEFLETMKDAGVRRLIVDDGGSSDKTRELCERFIKENSLPGYSQSQQ